MSTLKSQFSLFKKGERQIVKKTKNRTKSFFSNFPWSYVRKENFLKKEKESEDSAIQNWRNFASHYLKKNLLKN